MTYLPILGRQANDFSEISWGLGMSTYYLQKVDKILVNF